MTKCLSMISFDNSSHSSISGSRVPYGIMRKERFHLSKQKVLHLPKSLVQLCNKYLINSPTRLPYLGTTWQMMQFNSNNAASTNTGGVLWNPRTRFKNSMSQGLWINGSGSIPSEGGFVNVVCVLTEDHCYSRSFLTML